MAKSVKHRPCLKSKYPNYKIFPITKEYFEETEYHEDIGLFTVYTVGMNDNEYYKLIRIER